MRIPAALIAAATLTVGLAACAPAAGPAAPTGPVPVVGQGTVIQVGDAAPELCLGAIAESYPPQCSGPEVSGWDWSSVAGQETSGDITWGTYAVWGDWDGTALAVTSQIQLALYDPMPIIDSYEDTANAGSTSDARLQEIQAELFKDAPVEVLLTSIHNGYLFTTVVFDDGSVQAWANETYGTDVVLIRPALRLVQ